MRVENEGRSVASLSASAMRTTRTPGWPIRGTTRLDEELPCMELVTTAPLA
jgi:hypothetical protein